MFSSNEITGKAVVLTRLWTPGFWTMKTISVCQSICLPVPWPSFSSYDPSAPEQAPGAYITVREPQGKFLTDLTCVTGLSGNNQHGQGKGAWHF